MRVITAVLLSALVLIIGGCFDYEEHLVLNADGSGSVKMHFAMNRAYVDQMQAMVDASGLEEDNEKPEEMMFNKAEIEEMLEAEGGGASLVSHSFAETDESYVWDLELAFTSMDDMGVMGSVMAADESGLVDDDTPAEIAFFEQNDGTWLFTRSLNPDQGEADDFGDYSEEYGSYDDYADGQYDEDIEFDSAAVAALAEAMAEGMQELAETMSEGMEGSSEGMPEGMEGFGEGMPEGMEGFAEAMAAMNEQMANHKLRFMVTFPGEIVESNAASIEGNTAIWEFQLNQDMEEMPDFHAVIKP